MKTKTVTLYEWDELTKEQQKKVLDNYRDWNTEGDWECYIRDQWIEKLKDIGFENAKISYSGFGSQGDGASFTADINFTALLDHIAKRTKKEKTEILKAHTEGNLEINLVRISSRYYHENTCKIEVSDSLTVMRADMVVDLEADLEALRYNLCKELYKAFETEYEYLRSDEALTEYFSENQYTFNAQTCMMEN